MDQARRPPLPQSRNRRSIRLRSYDYTLPGAYFFTICTQGQEGLQDETPVRDTFESVWHDLPNRFYDVRLDAFVVMPDHVHGIIIIEDPRKREIQDPRRGEIQDPRRGEIQNPRRGEIQNPRRGEIQDPCRGEIQDPCRGEIQDPCRGEPCVRPEGRAGGAIDEDERPFPDGNLAPDAAGRADTRSAPTTKFIIVEDPRRGEIRERRGDEIQNPCRGEIRERRGDEIQNPRRGEIQNPCRGEIQNPRRGEIQDPRRGEIQDPRRGEIQDPRRGEPCVRPQGRAGGAPEEDERPFSEGDLAPGGAGRADTRSAPTAKFVSAFDEPASLGRVIQAFKSLTTLAYVRGVKSDGWKSFAGRLWQRNYYEHVVRTEAEFNRVREYIANNTTRSGLNDEALPWEERLLDVGH